MSKFEMVFGFLSGLLFLSLTIWFATALHMAYTKIDVILEHLKNSPEITSHSGLLKDGLRGRLKLISNICDYVTSPNKGIKNGTISAEDIENLPKPIKRKLIILRHSIVLLVLSLALLWCTGTLYGK